VPDGTGISPVSVVVCRTVRCEHREHVNGAASKLDARTPATDGRVAGRVPGRVAGESRRSHRGRGARRAGAVEDHASRSAQNTSPTSRASGSTRR
jgi:hypothetical protein